MSSTQVSRFTMGAFLLLGILSLIREDYLAAGVNIALGLSFGAVDKPWRKLGQSRRVFAVVCGAVATVLFVYILVSDLLN